ncbi:MAG: hypothetical protein PVH68_17555, partial [Armatimonadota bacterium]
MTIGTTEPDPAKFAKYEDGTFEWDIDDEGGDEDYWVYWYFDDYGDCQEGLNLTTVQHGTDVEGVYDVSVDVYDENKQELLDSATGEFWVLWVSISLKVST